MGRDHDRRLSETCSLFQSTRPRGARPVDDVMVADGLVSIHAPTWGATCHHTILGNVNCFNPRAHVGRDPLTAIDGRGWAVSIHAPTWGATQMTSDIVEAVKFQSTRPRGARHKAKKILARQQVSIHAPTWGATGANAISYNSTRFQSTRPRGARPSALLNLIFHSCFNPRAHVGRDHGRRRNGSRWSCFNPRAHVGRDLRSFQCP